MLRSILVFLAFVGTSSVGIAQESFFVGVGLGSSQIELGSLDESDTATAVFAGYRFAEGGLPLDGTLGIEITYGDLGSPSGVIAGQPAKLDLSGIVAQVTASKPVGDRVSLLGKIGVISWKQDYTIADISGSSDGTDVSAGIAAEVTDADWPVSIRFGIDGHDFADGVWTYSVSALFQFGRNR